MEPNLSKEEIELALECVKSWQQTDIDDPELAPPNSKIMYENIVRHLEYIKPK